MAAPLSIPGPRGSLRIRPVAPDDVPAIAAIYAPIVRETTISYELEPPTEAELARRIEATTAQFPWLVAEQEGRVEAYAYASMFRARPAYRFGCESTIYAAPGARGKGIARRLYTALLSTLRAQGYAMVYAGISLPNDASVRLHESLGFTPVGVFRRAGWKLGRWCDAGFWQLDLAPGATPEAEPVPWSLLRHEASTQAILAG